MEPIFLHLAAWRRIALALALGGAASAGFATTYEPPEFSELAVEAEQVVRGRVVGVRSFRTEHAGQPLIETEVTLAVAENEQGPRTTTLTLSMLGGRLGDEVMHVDAMPELVEGEDVILFVRGNRRVVCPIVGWSHGAFRVRRAGEAGGREYVERWNGEPLRSLAQVPEPLTPPGARRAADASAALAPDQFLSAVRMERERRNRAY